MSKLDPEKRSNDTGSRIKQRRKEMGMTQEELAYQLFMTRTALSKIENGVQEPSFKLVQKISIILRCTPNDFCPPNMSSELNEYYLMKKKASIGSIMDASKFMDLFEYLKTLR